MARRVLADVEAREVEAEHLDLADHVAQVAGGGERPWPLAQGALGRAQVGEQLVRGRVAAPARRGASRARARAMNEKARR